MSIRRSIDKAVRFGSRAAEILQEFTGPKELDRGTVATTYDGKTLAECERQWESIGVLAAEGWRGIRDIGIYSVHLRKLVYIGRVVYRQGFHWRMQQYNSGSYPGKTTPAARRIHANRRAVEIKILRMKSVDATKVLEKALIAKCAPPWNNHHNS